MIALKMIWLRQSKRRVRDYMHRSPVLNGCFAEVRKAAVHLGDDPRYATGIKLLDGVVMKNPLASCRIPRLALYARCLQWRGHVDGHE